MEKVLIEQRKKGVTLVLGQPVMQEDTLPSSTSPKRNCLVSCGLPVIIKRVPQPHRAKIVCADNPFKEIAALQYLQEQDPQYGGHHPNVIHLIDALQGRSGVFCFF